MSKLNSSHDGLTSLGVPAARGPLYELALTHRSFAFERAEPTGHNERLEFLGDSILGAIVTALIYERFPEMSEGDMARLRASVVNTDALAEEARRLGLGAHIRLGKGEEATGGREKSSLLANVFEALVGAVYVDRGMAAIERSLKPLFDRKVTESVAAGPYDSKTSLQEVVVRRTGELPTYRVASSGPDHDKSFVAHVYIDDETFGSGTGKSKKEAEQNAAREALDRLAEQTGALDRFSEEAVPSGEKRPEKEESDARAS